MPRLPFPSTAATPAKKRPPVPRYGARIRSLATAAIASLLSTLVITLACASPSPNAAPPTPSPTTPPAIIVPTIDLNDDAISSHLATKLLETGNQRIAFLLSTQKALVNSPSARISLSRHPDFAELSQTLATYNPWPYGVRGSYSASIEFPQPGNYRLTVTPVDGEVTGHAIIPVTVLNDAPVPSVGDIPPASQTKTLSHDGFTLADLTTSYQPDPELYRLSVADAIASGRPTVIVFATPAFCTSPTCGPQVDTVAELRAANPDAANYIHVELYDNPAQIQGDLSAAQLIPAAHEWGFTQIPHWTNESWVFVLDADGVIRHRFEGFVTRNELQSALDRLPNP